MMDDFLDRTSTDHILKYTSNMLNQVYEMATRASHGIPIEELNDSLDMGEEIYMIPYEWKDMSSDEIIPLIKKHKIQTKNEHFDKKEKVALVENKKSIPNYIKAYHPIIQKEKLDWLKNNNSYQELWFWGCETPQWIKDGMSLEEFEKESEKRSMNPIMTHLEKK